MANSSYVKEILDKVKREEEEKLKVENKKYIESLINNGRLAQKEYEKFTQEQVDIIVREIGKTVYDRAEELAKMAIEETGMGVYEHKVAKNKGKSKVIWNNLKDKKSIGIIGEDKDKSIIKIAKPMGVIASVTPCTNPIVTPMCNAMFALKGGNAIIVAPHPRAKKCAKYVVDLFREAIEKLGAPKNLIQTIEEPSIDLTSELMSQVDVVIATGGMGMVKSAYSSGKPAYGVGAGNVQCIIDREVDIKDVVPKIISGRTFDNGIICSGEQSIIAPKENYKEIIDEFIKNGAYYAEDNETIEKFEKVLFPQGTINGKVVGQSVEFIASLAGVNVPKDTKVIILKARGKGTEDVLCKEKMCPVMVSFKYENFKEAVEIAQANLNVEGKGHSAAIHSNNKDHIEYAGRKLTVSRLVVNQPSSTTAGGSLYNGFAPTTTLGCGSWGNNSISENLDYKHLINISRIGFYKADAKVPTDEEIWAK
ncbi:MAG: aldehyde dehydrogenase family protein [Clostridium argentinense]|uniref:Aldehyde dehydrogenase family protein n=1 Tax=Clostridium faecium TaxID=2762223 RepID=A0ABR8YQN1_9CLOT|nr:aldehyde dehydrogenase family protein [Clostridium faecium]MBD8046561.1 aldehyde dehydrogenase family protein [Clostridium faecium]MBS5822748.1 aldehyde dehydrogenase family protein [Clostridium argentinense]MDU1348104.1 aldehyde dehydrogenase family protein [Clostridium argentinense]